MDLILGNVLVVVRWGHLSNDCPQRRNLTIQEEQDYQEDSENEDQDPEDINLVWEHDKGRC